jgi:hypothetical protein
MVIAILTKADPEDSNSRLLTRAKWVGLNYIKAQLLRQSKIFLISAYGRKMFLISPKSRSSAERIFLL